MTTPNQEFFGPASQTRTPNEIVESRFGSYTCNVPKTTGKTPPPAAPESFKLKGA